MSIELNDEISFSQSIAMTDTQSAVVTEIVSKESETEKYASQDKQKEGYDFNTIIEKYDRETVSKTLKAVIV